MNRTPTHQNAFLTQTELPQVSKTRENRVTDTRGVSVIVGKETCRYSSPAASVVRLPVDMEKGSVPLLG